MPGFDDIAWFPLCAGLTVLGLIATWLAWRRRGAASGLRLGAWSLLPLVAYLTGIVSVLWEIGTAIAGWAASFVVSPTVWAGVGLAGLAVVGFVVSGVLKRRAGSATRDKPAAERAQPAEMQRSAAGQLQGDGDTAGSTQQLPTSSKAKSAADTSNESDSSAEDDFSDVEEILRRRGIS